MPNKIAIIQSNYIPWKGYFDIIRKVDHFVFLDTAQYTIRDWRNRNRIKTANGIKWLTVPCKGTQSMRICDVEIDNCRDWRKKHLNSLELSYVRTPYFKKCFPIIREWFYYKDWKYLSEMNQYFIKQICGLLGITTQFHNSSEFHLISGKNEKIITIIKQLSGDYYISGPAALAYLNEELFNKQDIEVNIMDYSNYPVYNQPWQDFNHHVSILDLIFCTGSGSTKYLEQK